MERNVIFFAWNRSVPGREHISAAHFQEFLDFLGAQKGAGAIEGFDRRECPPAATISYPRFRRARGALGSNAWGET